MAKTNNPMINSMSEEDRISELKLLKNSYDMYERTKAETEEHRRTAVNKDGTKKYSEASTKKTLQLLETMQEDIVKKYLMLGGTMDELKAKKRGRKPKDAYDRMAVFKQILAREKEEAMNNAKNADLSNIDASNETSAEEEVELSYYSDVDEALGNALQEEEVAPDDDPKQEEPEKKTIDNSFSVDITKARGNNIKYDIIPLPSNGQCYKNKMSKIPVSYLTAYDENMIVSPNMYRDGTFLDYILKAKVMTDEIDTADMLPGDRDAIILWLRASGYGNEFPVNAIDNATGQQFDAVVDLTKLKYKKFNLKGDVNGHFSFELPVTHDKVKFKFLTYGDIKALEKMEESEVASIRKGKVLDIADDLEEYISKEEDIEKDLRIALSDAVKTVRKFGDTIKDNDEEQLYSHSVTNRLCKSIVSINGITDRGYIDEYVMYMNVRDSSALRKYISDNEPGVDFNIEVERPKSLGGGSVRMFLTIDQYIFLTIA